MSFRCIIGAVVAIPLCISAQQLIIRSPDVLPGPLSVSTPNGPVSGSASALEQSPEVLILLAADSLDPADREPIRQFTEAVYKTAHASRTIRLAVLTGSSLDVAGPFRTAAELQTVLRKTRAESNQPSAPNALDFLTELPAALSPVPSQWGYTVIVGHMPQLPDNLDGSIPRYVAAYLTRAFIAQKRALIFWDPQEHSVPAWADALARDTGGAICQKESDLLDLLSVPAQIVAVNWADTALSRGYDLQSIQAGPRTTSAIRAASQSSLPSISEFMELRAKTSEVATVLAAPDKGETQLKAVHANLDRALAINPSDRAALKLGIELAALEKNVPDAISLLQSAVELDSQDASLWSALGDLQYERKDLKGAEASLLHARAEGVKGARISEELGRIRLEAGDSASAISYIDESLNSDPSQQALWFLGADVASRLKDVNKEARMLEHGLALGGTHIDLRSRLIRLYLEKGDLVNAGRNADLELQNIADDADTQSTWAEFYQQLGRTEDALSCWRRAIKADPRREPAQFAAIKILSDRKNYSDVLQAADQALDSVVSPRLELAKVTALEKLDRLYDARRFLGASAAKSGDLDVLKHAADLSDAFGGDAPLAYRRYSEALKAANGEVPRAVLQRGLRVSARENDVKNSQWFASQIPGSSTPPSSGSTGTLKGIWIPGGLEALAFAAQGQTGVTSDGFMAEFARTVLVHEETPERVKEYERLVSNYFQQLTQLLAIAVRKGNQSTITLSLADKKLQKQTETVFNLFGWKLRRTKQQVTIESGVNASQARRQDLPSALAVDQAAIQQAFQQGKPFVLQIAWEWAPLVITEDELAANFQIGKYPGGLPEAMAHEQSLAKLYVALSNLDQATAGVLISGIGLKPLASRYADRFSLYSSALAVNAGRAVTPGGASADLVWTKLTGVSPANPAAFFRALFDKDEGKLLAWFFTLSQLDFEHQHFFTLNPARTAQFFDFFSHSADVAAGAGRYSRNASFLEFLREVPLNDGAVDFPGSPEVWMVAKGVSKSSARTQSLLRKAHKSVAPDVEDEILLRLARTRYTAVVEHLSELDNFIAVVRIEKHRSEPLEEESALLLAQNFAAYSGFYPYFSTFQELRSDDFKAFFSFAEKLKASSPVETDLILGQFDSLVELMRLGVESGQIPGGRAARLFGSLCNAFLSATDIPAYTKAALDLIRTIIPGEPGSESAYDNALRTIAAGKPVTAEFEWDDVSRSIDTGKARTVAFGRVLDLQKVTPIGPLLRIESAARALAAGTLPYARSIDAIQRDADALLLVETPKEIKAKGQARQSLARTNSSKLPQIIEELRQKTSRKKVNAKDLEKLYRDVLVELAPQLRLALSGLVYAAYLGPDDILVANDPLLVRKHQFFALEKESPTARTLFSISDLNISTDNQGSFFRGSFAQFAGAAGFVASIGGRQGNRNSALFARQVGSIRATPWELYRDSDQQLLGLRLRIAREWCVYAADDSNLLRDLAEDTFGILSLGRRRELLNAVQARRWDSALQALTLSDLFSLSTKYLARYDKSPWNSPVDAALRQAESTNNGERLNLLGSVMTSIYGCNHRHLAALAPYEEYEHHLFPVDMAERSAEIKLYLSAYLDRIGVTAALMPVISEAVAKQVFATLHMADERDWASAMKAFALVDSKSIAAALEQ